jgi:lipopolysaccharide/colanic/teichoic acid biosynthesis glycosyltransferase
MTVRTAHAQGAIFIDRCYLGAKRLLDLLIILLFMLPLSIIILIIAILIKWDSKGPVFFRQRRVGLNGVEFNMFKFRSMYVNCDDSTHREAIKQYINGEILNNEAASHNLYKLNDDPRITRVGRIIRKTSLDEIPQFWNVLRGEMTLVGPRPPLPYEVELYSSRDQLRLCGKPGLTGVWQVYGRSQVPFQSMVEMDIQYLQQQSLWQDIKLIFLTIPIMISGRGGI